MGHRPGTPSIDEYVDPSFSHWQHLIFAGPSPAKNISFRHDLFNVRYSLELEPRDVFKRRLTVSRDNFSCLVLGSAPRVKAGSMMEDSIHVGVLWVCLKHRILVQ